MATCLTKKYKVCMKVEATKRWSFHLSNLVLESISHESYAGCLKEEAPVTCQPQSESLWASPGCTTLEQELAIFGAAEAARRVLTCIDRSTKKHALGCSMTQGKCFLAGWYQLSRVSQPGIPRWLVGILKKWCHGHGGSPGISHSPVLSQVVLLRVAAYSTYH